MLEEVTQDPMREPIKELIDEYATIADKNRYKNDKQVITDYQQGRVKWNYNPATKEYDYGGHAAPGAKSKNKTAAIPKKTEKEEKEKKDGESPEKKEKKPGEEKEEAAEAKPEKKDKEEQEEKAPAEKKQAKEKPEEEKSTEEAAPKKESPPAKKQAKAKDLQVKKEEAPRKEETSESVAEKASIETPAREVEMEVLNQKEDARTFDNLLTAYDHLQEETAQEVGQNANAQNIVDQMLS